MDPEDIAIAEAEDTFAVPGEKLADYGFQETPSSPQFFLYSMGSPEDAAVWHAVGSFASPSCFIVALQPECLQRRKVN